MRLFLATAIIGMVSGSPLSAQPAPTPDAVSRHETKYLKTCAKDTQKDCSRLHDLVGLPADKASVRAAREACDQMNKAMSSFCMIAADHPPESREVMTAVSEVIAAKKAMSKAVDAAKADRS